MSRSRNSRRGSTNKHRKRHFCCDPGCSTCNKNFKHAERRQAMKGME